MRFLFVYLFLLNFVSCDNANKERFVDTDNINFEFFNETKEFRDIVEKSLISEESLANLFEEIKVNASENYEEIIVADLAESGEVITISSVFLYFKNEKCKAVFYKNRKITSIKNIDLNSKLFKDYIISNLQTSRPYNNNLLILDFEADNFKWSYNQSIPPNIVSKIKDFVELKNLNL